MRRGPPVLAVAEGGGRHCPCSAHGTACAGAHGQRCQVRLRRGETSALSRLLEQLFLDTIQ